MDHSLTEIMSPAFDLREAAALDAGRARIVAIRRAGRIEPTDIAALRNDVLADRAPTREEADALFELDGSSAARGADWLPFFAAAITDHVVWQMRPTGALSGAQAEWLIERADASHTIAAFAVLVSVLSEAHRVPQWFLAAVRARAARGWPGLDAALAAAVIETARAA